MFKNLMLYRLPAPWAITASQLDEILTPHALTPCASLDLQSQGWTSPRGAGLAHAVNHQILLNLTTEKKIMPAAAITQLTKARAAEQEEAQGFGMGKNAMKELKERVADEMLPRAFSVKSTVQVWIDPVNGWLAIDTASTGRADEVVRMLLKAIEKMPIESVRVQRSPTAAMTEWLQSDEAPAGFTVDQDAEMRSSGEGHATVRYVNHTLEADDVRRHIAAGKRCTRMAMTWNGKISFVLTEALAIKSVKAIGVLKEAGGSQDADERFDGDMMLMTGELALMLVDLIDSLGGEAGDLASPAGAVATSTSLHDGVAEVLTNLKLLGGAGLIVEGFIDGPDPLYDQAVEIVRKNNRASISLVQRHTRIGYNRAARLIESMEINGVVSARASNGDREVCHG